MELIFVSPIVVIKYVEPLRLVHTDKNSRLICDGGLSNTSCVKNMWKCPKKNQMSEGQTGGGSPKKKNWGSHIMTSILTSRVKVTEIGHKHILWTF